MWKTCTTLLREQRAAKALFGAFVKECSDVLSREMRACSACAGDYEDPDRTAWPAAGEEEAEAVTQEGEDEFPEDAS